MGIFFEARPMKPAVQAAVRTALQQNAVADDAAADATASQVADNVAAQAGGIGQPRILSFVIAAVLLAVLAIAAVWAESAKLSTAPPQLWTAFQTVLGVIVGFLGGEATGAATAKQA